MQTSKAILLLSIIVLFSKCVDNKKETNQITPVNIIDYLPTNAYKISNGNQTKPVYAPKIKSNWFDSINQIFKNKAFEQYDNKYWVYTEFFHDTLYKMFNEDKFVDSLFFKKLTKGQKIFYSSQVFLGEVDNGGVWQFFFNRPEQCYATLESFKVLKLEKLEKDYEKCLTEFLVNADKLKNRQDRFSDASENWEERWKSFSEGYVEIKSAKELEDYFYTEEFKKNYFDAMTNYIDEHKDEFCILEK